MDVKSAFLNGYSDEEVYVELFTPSLLILHILIMFID